MMLENIFQLLGDGEKGLLIIMPDCTTDPDPPPPGFRTIYPLAERGWFSLDSAGNKRRIDARPWHDLEGKTWIDLDGEAWTF